MAILECIANDHCAHCDQSKDRKQIQGCSFRGLRKSEAASERQKRFSSCELEALTSYCCVARKLSPSQKRSKNTTGEHREQRHSSGKQKVTHEEASR